MNTLSVGTAPIVGPLIGWVLDHPIAFGSHHAVMAGSMAAYQQSFTIFLVCLLLGSVIGYYLPKRPVVIDEEESLIEDTSSNEDALDTLDRII